MNSSEIEQSNATNAIHDENDQQGQFIGDATRSASYIDEIGGEESHEDCQGAVKSSAYQASPRRPQHHSDSALHENYVESPSSTLRRRTSPGNSPQFSGRKSLSSERASSMPTPPNIHSGSSSFDEDNMQNNNNNDSLSNDATSNDLHQAQHHINNERHQTFQGTTRTVQEAQMLQQFWRTYDTIIILSIFAVLGIMFRMMSATWFRMELGSVFSEDSALGTNLPLNIWSCFLMGLLCSGRDAMGIVQAKVLGGANPYGSGRGIIDVGRGAYRGVIDTGRAGINRARGYGNINRRRRRSSLSSSEVPENMTAEMRHHSEQSQSNSSLHRRRGNGNTMPQSSDDDAAQDVPPNYNNQSVNGSGSIAGLMGLDDEFRIVGSNQNSEDEIREVQLRGLTRRIMSSPSLVFFPARKEDNDVMEHYENTQPSQSSTVDNHFEIGDIELSEQSTPPSGESSGEASGRQEAVHSPSRLTRHQVEMEQLSPGGSSSRYMTRQQSEPNTTIEEQVDEMINSISENVTTLRRIDLLEGWNVDVSPEKMKDIILLGLRVGFCGALSTFSSLNASVIRLLRKGSIGEALVGYALSLQLGIVSYRTGQHLAVYIFVWRCRRETKRDERRGYGLRLQGPDADEEQAVSEAEEAKEKNKCHRYIIPSVRTMATVSFIAMFVSLGLAIHFTPSRQQYLLSLLFTPLGCLARWRLMGKYNKKVPGFPLGTFSCNILSCALSGSLGSFLAGNPGPEESIVLQSLIAGFAGSLSSFAAFIVEILSLIDPILFKFDGMVYAMITILWAVIIGFLGSQAKNWADEI